MSPIECAKIAIVSFLDAVFPAGVIRYYLLTKSRHYEPELWLVPCLLSPKGIALDVGANRGIWSIQFAIYSDHVHAFEPNLICLSATRCWATLGP